NVREQPPEQGLGTVALSSPRLGFWPPVALPATVSVSVAPAHAWLMLPTVTELTLPLLSTAREKLKLPLWHGAIRAVPAPTPAEPTASVAAAAQLAVIKAAARMATRTARSGNLIGRSESHGAGGR